MAPLRILPRDHARPTALDARAEDNLRFIRDVMERATAFTAISGWGQLLAGVVGLIAASITLQQADRGAWLLTWLLAAVVAVLVAGGLSVRKALHRKLGLFTAAGKRFLLNFAAPLLAGALLTAFFYRLGIIAQLPPLWLLLFGVGVVCGGAFAVRIVPLMGGLFMLLGAAAAFSPVEWGDFYMALGFGVLNIVFGFLIARRYGG